MKTPFFHSLPSRLIVFNVAGFLVTCLAFFYFLDRYQYRTLLERIDNDLESEILVITSRLDEPDDLVALRDELNRVSLATGISRAFYRTLDERGVELASSDLAFWPAVAAHPLPMDRLTRESLPRETAALKPGPARVMYYRFPEGPILQVGYDLAEVREIMSQSRKMIGTGIVLVILVSGLFSFLITYRGLRGIRTIDSAARRISEQGTLDVRVPRATGSAETDRLAHAFNQMLDHIETLMNNLRNVMDNIAHDIKTPVTRMRVVAESELTRKDAPDLELAGQVIESCDLILNLVNTLLQITAAESGLYPWDIEEIDLAELVREGCDLFEPVMEERQLALSTELPEKLLVQSDSRALQRVLSNLIDNAAKYTDAGGKVMVHLQKAGSEISLTVSDSGIGIPEEERDLIFGRFYRSDRSRTRPGNGLGLSFCKAAVEALGGTITCTASPGGGTTFRVTLPET